MRARGLPLYGNAHSSGCRRSPERRQALTLARRRTDDVAARRYLPLACRHGRPSVVMVGCASGNEWSVTTGKGLQMLHYAVVFFVIAIIAAVLGFTGIAAGAAEIAKVLFVIFLLLFVVSLIVGLLRRNS